MGRILLVQPNGLLAIFSSTVDDFVAYDMTREEALAELLEDAKREAERQIERALEVPSRFDEAIDTIRTLQSDRKAEEWRAAMSAKPEAAGGADAK